tara:strand:- start:1995 stop:2207 length:213 start_codon:yes stop_codon:yes gene_type:complete
VGDWMKDGELVGKSVIVGDSILGAVGVIVESYTIPDSEIYNGVFKVVYSDQKVDVLVSHKDHRKDAFCFA